MSLASGTRIGLYEITGTLGAGGMGEVYRARDTRLKREVALKILPESFASVPDRLARFQREAEVLASLNHPNIAGIYGIEESNGTRALVLELVEGETLADRIARGPIPPDEALAIAKQIAEALEAAHEQGIIHRDLKPANIKVRPDGTVKVLDFGLAKLAESGSRSGDQGSGVPAHLTNSPTLMSPAMMTGVGVILGTAAYMAPEQAKGRPADKRSDVWAFGCVLYEMLAGRPPFAGETVSETLAEVMKSEPAWDALPAGVAPRIGTVLRRCLEKNPDRRVRHIGDVWLALEGGFETPADPQDARTSRGRPAIWWVAAVAALALVASAAAGGVYLLRPAADLAVVRFTIDPPTGLMFQGNASAVASSTGSISPDGQRLVFPVRDAAGGVQLWVREFDALAARPLPGTENAAYQFWSADSQSVGFFAGGKLHRVDLAGGRPRVLADASAGRGGTWNRDGVILFASGAVYRIPASGGEAVAVTKRAADEGEHASPVFLPDQRHFLFLRAAQPGSAGNGIGAVVHVGDVVSGETRPLLEANTKAMYAPPGYLLFVRQGTLMAQRFDADTLTLSGDPISLAENVAWDTHQGGFSVSQTGTLIYRLGPGPTDAETFQLAWLDRSGISVRNIGTPARYAGLDLSRNGGRVAYHRHEGDGGDIWLLDASSGSSSRLTFGPDQDNSSPIWSPDGSRVVFVSRRGSRWGLYARRADGVGNEELLLEADVPLAPMTWSPDSRSIVYGVSDPKTKGDLALWSLTDRTSVPLMQTDANEEYAEVSPDGRWIAYQSDETGRPEVFVRPFPGLAGRWQISTTGGYYPRWRADGRELFFFDGTRGTLRAVTVNPTANAAFAFSPPQPLFNTGYSFGTTHAAGSFRYAPSADGLRFLLPRPSAETGQLGASSPITVVLNWAAALEGRR